MSHRYISGHRHPVPSRLLPDRLSARHPIFARRALRMIERCSFLELRTADLELARAFWVHQLGLSVTEEESGHYFAVDAGGLRLCVDVSDGFPIGGIDTMMIAFEVTSVSEAIGRLARRGLRVLEAPISGPKGLYVRLQDPDGRLVVLAEDGHSRRPKR